MAHKRILGGNQGKALDIIRIVSDVFGTNLEEMSSSIKLNQYSCGNAVNITMAKFTAMSLISNYYTLSETAKMFLRDNHTTVISAKKKLDNAIATDMELKAKVISVLQKLK